MHVCVRVFFFWMFQYILNKNENECHTKKNPPLTKKLTKWTTATTTMKQWYITPKMNKEHTTKISPLNNTHSLPDRRRRWRTFRHTDIHKQIQHMYAHTYKHNYLYTSIQPMHSPRQVVVVVGEEEGNFIMKSSS